MAQGIKIYNDAGTFSTKLDFGNPTSDRTVALDDLAKTADLKEIGVGQTWQNVTGSRVAGTTYTNTTGKPIVIQVYAGSTASAVNLRMTASINGGGGFKVLDAQNASFIPSGVFALIIPVGATYNIKGYANTTLGSTTILEWYELR